MINILNVQWDDNLQKLSFITNRENIFDISFFIDGFPNLNKFIDNDVIFCDTIPDDKYTLIINHQNTEVIRSFLRKNKKLLDDTKIGKCRMIVTHIEGAVNNKGYSSGIGPGCWPDFLNSFEIPFSNFIVMTPELLLNGNDKNLPITYKFFNRWAIIFESVKRNHHQLNLSVFNKTQRFSRLKYFYTVATSPRPHRIDLINFLNKNNFLDKGHITMFNQVFDNDVYLSSKNIHSNSLGFNPDELIPLGKDLKSYNGISPTFAINDVKSMNSYYQIITASIYDEDVLSDKFHVFFNEKIWKSIITLNPFIFIGQYKTLECLRNMGFKTFNPFIDESYDDIKGWKNKKNVIFREIKRLNSMSRKEIHDWYWNMKDILIHNYNRLSEYSDEQYDDFIKLLKENDN